MNKVVDTKKSYSKPTLNYQEMIDLLASRGLSFGDKDKIRHYLQHTGYYRLSAYFKSYQTKDDKFFPGTSFDEIWNLYIFDRKLRLHTLDAIEKIEVSLKANMNDILSLKKGCFRYLDETSFDLIPRKQTKLSGIGENIKAKQPNDIYQEFIHKIDNIEKSSREIIKYYQSKYTTQNLPSWILFQELTLGEISNIYNILPQTIRQEIANVYGVYERDLKNWIQTLMNIRNICAHHGRLWNRRYIFKARMNDTVLKGKFQTWVNINGYKEVIPNYYNFMLILSHLLKEINKNFDWITDLKALLDKYQNKYNKNMGFKGKWYENI